jgi:hypothetical protein
MEFYLSSLSSSLSLAFDLKPSGDVRFTSACSSLPLSGYMDVSGFILELSYPSISLLDS